MVAGTLATLLLVQELLDWLRGWLELDLVTVSVSLLQLVLLGWVFIVNFGILCTNVGVALSGLQIIRMGKAWLEILTIGIPLRKVRLKRLRNPIELTAVEATTSPRLWCRGSSVARQLSRKLTPRSCLRVLLTTTALHRASPGLCRTRVSRTLLAMISNCASGESLLAKCIRQLILLLSPMFTLEVTCLVIACVVTW